MSMTKYGACPQQTSKTASGAPGNKEVKPKTEQKPKKEDKK